MESLKGHKPKGKTLSRHIIEDMLYMVELNPVNVRVCKKIFEMIDPDAKDINIFTGSFIDGKYKNVYKNQFKVDAFDVIMGNPPYNKGGIRAKNKKQGENKAETVWTIFVQKSLRMLKNDKYLLFINPATWIGLKSTNSKVFLDNQIISLRYYNYGQSLNLFGGVSGKIPLTYYLLQKSHTRKDTMIYDNCLDIFIPFNIYKNNYVPTEAIGLQSKLKGLSTRYGSLKGMVISPRTIKKYEKTKSNIYPVISIVNKNINIKYSNIINHNVSKSKLVFTNATMGYPLLDIKGNLMNDGSDKYYLYSHNIQNLKQYQDMLFTSLFFYIMNITRIRQNFLNNKVFEIIPDITKMTNKGNITDES